ncbi:MAG: AGE family epimerase/isomerase [Hyphomonadaceae bacterium]|nr:AGE family epimerase/isomerase [Hyphomonadaceae bacterium]
MTHTIHPVILCGGSGTRLWPLSTPERPKQFLALTSDRSMIEETAARFVTSEVTSLQFSETLVVGSKRHARLLTTALPDAKKILEPFGRNSAPAVAAASLDYDPEDLILILPADHDIRDVPAFHRAIEIAAKAAANDAIVTFGIEPSHPATGYGYIKSIPGAAGAAHAVEAFVEKPDLATAEAYLATGTYLWNAGIFLFKARTMLDALSEHAPDVLAGVKRAMAGAVSDTVHLDPDAFAETPSISIDYAVMENAANVQTVPVSMGWSDVGGYRALHELLTQSPSENCTSGSVVLQNAEGLYVRSEGPAISVNGVSNLVIVATPDEVMITPMEDDAAVKTLGAAVQSNRHALGISPDLRARAKDWLWSAFETWSKVGWDDTHGGFVEQLNMDGSPDREATRRVRVQARQVFSFAKAIDMGWPDPATASDLVARGIEYIDTRLRHAEGGFVHLINPDGSVIDDRRDLYDHAFMILAGSAAYRATGNQTALNIANDALAYVDTHLKDTERGGWFESSQFELPRRANPHMHMLEAMLEYHAATGSDAALDHAAEIVRLFETKFFNPATDIMAEFFNKDWSPIASEAETIWEPGHHYEWATLLAMFDQATGHDSVSWRRRLNRKADISGMNSQTGFLINQLKADGTVLNAKSRLWHQLERFRSQLIHPTQYSPSQSAAFADDVFDGYLGLGPIGGWLDELGADGQPISDKVPASMLYHAVTSLALLSA